MPTRSYKDYPSGYFKIIDYLSSNKEPMVLKGTEIKSLHSRRRDISRFFAAVATAAKEDKYAKELYEISKELTISISDEDLTLTIKLNEIDSMINEFFKEIGEDVSRFNEIKETEISAFFRPKKEVLEKVKEPQSNDLSEKESDSVENAIRRRDQM